VPNTIPYNGDGTRVQKQDSTGTTNFIWDEQNILEETDQNNLVQAIYTLEPVEYGNCVSQYRGASSQIFLFDGLGSTDRLADSLGNITDTAIYKAFGPIQNSTGGSIYPFKYVGEEGYYFDPDVTQYYLTTRPFYPLFGRYQSYDPLQFDAGDLNLFRYVNNNPVGFVDPSGLMTASTYCSARWNRCWHFYISSLTWGWGSNNKIKRKTYHDDFQKCINKLNQAFKKNPNYGIIWNKKKDQWELDNKVCKEWMIAKVGEGSKGVKRGSGKPPNLKMPKMPRLKKGPQGQGKPGQGGPGWGLGLAAGALALPFAVSPGILAPVIPFILPTLTIVAGAFVVWKLFNPWGCACRCLERKTNIMQDLGTTTRSNCYLTYLTNMVRWKCCRCVASKWFL
jgi:RHS repeat-associated protein